MYTYMLVRGAFQLELYRRNNESVKNLSTNSRQAQERRAQPPPECGFSGRLELGAHRLPCRPILFVGRFHLIYIENFMNSKSSSTSSR